MAMRVASVVLFLLLVACKDDAPGGLPPCGPGFTCSAGDVCDPTVNLCYRRGQNHCPELLLKPGGVPPADSGPTCTLLTRCCQDFTFDDGGTYNECTVNQGVCGNLDSACGFGCYPE